MIRGTTPSVELTLDGLSTLTLSKLYVTFENAGTNNQVIKPLADVTVSGNKITVNLTQSDTTVLKEGTINVQVRMKDTSGNAYATDISSFTLSGILQDCII